MRMPSDYSGMVDKGALHRLFEFADAHHLRVHLLQERFVNSRFRRGRFFHRLSWHPALLFLRSWRVGFRISDFAQGAAHRHLSSFLGEKLHESTRSGRLEFETNLLSLQFDQRLPPFYFVTFPFQPAHHCRFCAGDSTAFWHDHRCQVIHLWSELRKLILRTL